MSCSPRGKLNLKQDSGGTKKNREDNMKELIEKLKEQREKLAAAKEKYNKATEKFREEQKETLDYIDSTNVVIGGLTTDIKAEAVEEYKKTGTTKFYGGVGIQNRKSLEYDDKKAFKWALEHKLALSLNKSAFNTIAKAGDIDFVEEVITTKATFPPELK